MANVSEKVRMTSFSVETGLNPEEIRQAGLRSIEAGKRLMTSTIKEDQVASDGIRYVIKGPGGLSTQMSFVVSWQDVGGGRRKVSFQIGRYTTSRPVVMGFIPAGPKSAPALRSAQRFAESLRVELAQR